MDKSEKEILNDLVFQAISTNDLPSLKALVEGGADVNGIYTGRDVHQLKVTDSMLMIAIPYHNFDMIHYLIEQGADVNKALRSKVTAIMLLLINEDIMCGAAPRTRNYYKDLLKTMTLMVAKGADIHAKALNGNNLLMYATELAQNFDFIKATVELFGDSLPIKDINDNGDTALTFLFIPEVCTSKSDAYIEEQYEERYKIANLLISLGVDVDAVNKQGETALTKAIFTDNLYEGNRGKVYKAQVKLIKLLVDKSSIIQESIVKERIGFKKEIADILKEPEAVAKFEIPKRNPKPKKKAKWDKEIQNYVTVRNNSNSDAELGSSARSSAAAQGSSVANSSAIPSLSALTFDANLSGSTGAKLYKDTATGKKWVVKQADKGGGIGQVRNEAAVNAIYAALKVPVPPFKFDKEGRALILESIDGVLLAKATTAQREKAIKELSAAFVVDALLANWDVIGLGYDNIILPANGSPAVRIDNGGALEYRAKGGVKSLGPTVDELDTMRDKKANPSASKIFGHLTTADIEEQIKTIIRPNKALILHLTPPSIREVMHRRIIYMTDEYSPEEKAIPETNVISLGRIFNISEIAFTSPGPKVSTRRDSTDDIKDTIDERAMAGAKLTGMDLATIKEFSKSPRLNRFLSLNEMYSFVHEPLNTFLRSKFTPASTSADPATYSQMLLYYYFVNLYNAIQKRPIETPMKLLRVFRGTRTWYMGEEPYKFYYMNAFASTSPLLRIAKGFTKDYKKIYVYYAHPFARFMNIDPVSYFVDENEVLFSPYNRYLYVDTRIVKGNEYKIYCVVPTDLVIPKTFSEFMEWKGTIQDKVTEYDKLKMHEELAVEAAAMKGGRVGLLNRTRRVRSPPRNAKKTARARSASRPSSKGREERWICSLPVFPGKAPTKAEMVVIEQMKRLIEKDDIVG